MNEWPAFFSSNPDPGGGDWELYTDIARPAFVFNWVAEGTAYAFQVVQRADGKFYLYFPVTEAASINTDKFAIGVAIGDSPLGPSTDAHPSGPIISQSVPSPGNTIQNIDPTIFIDDDGSVYLYEGTFSELRGYELADDMVTITSSTTTTNNSGEGSPCTPTSYYACIAYGTASSPLGPWTFQGIVLGIVSSTTSYSGVFLLNDAYYLVYHIADSVDGGHFRRSIAFDVVTLDDSQSPRKINKVTQTHRPAGATEPARNIALAAIAGSVNTTPIQYWIASVNAGRIPVNPLLPDYWSSYAATDSSEANQLTPIWNTSGTLNGTRMVFFADQGAGSNIGVPPPSIWSVEYLGNVRCTHSTYYSAPIPPRFSHDPFMFIHRIQHFKISNHSILIHHTHDLKMSIPQQKRAMLLARVKTRSKKKAQANHKVQRWRDAKLQAKLQAKKKRERQLRHEFLTTITTDPGRLYPIYCSLMAALDTKGILRLYQTSKAIRKAVMEREWDVNKRLKAFVDDPCAFRTVMGRTNSLIVGSFALQFFERVNWGGSLTMTVTRDGLKDMKKYLTANEFYTPEDEEHTDRIEGGDQSPEDALSGLYWYTCGYRSLTRGSKVIRLILIVVEPTIPVPFAEFSTTSISNFISWKKAYALFPYHTFLKHETVPLKLLDDFNAQELNQWGVHGWKLRGPPLSIQDVQKISGPLSKFRRIGDNNTWAICLGINSITTPEVPELVLHNYHFTFTNNGSNDLVSHNGVEYFGAVNHVRTYSPHLGDTFERFAEEATIEIAQWAELFRSHALKYVYPAAGMEALETFLNRDVLMQLHKLRKDAEVETNNQKLDWGHIMGSGNPRTLNLSPDNLKFEHPEGWTYWDEELPRLFKEFGGG
ncbi:putative Glycosyl hydrolase family 43 protein [Seiridium cardinale]